MTRKRVASALLALSSAAFAAGCASPKEPDYAGEELVCEWQTRPQYVGSSVRVRPERVCRPVAQRAEEPPPMPAGVKPSGGRPARIEVESEESAPDAK